jgi:hypothetical protein
MCSGETSPDPAELLRRGNAALWAGMSRSLGYTDIDTPYEQEQNDGVTLSASRQIRTIRRSRVVLLPRWQLKWMCATADNSIRRQTVDPVTGMEDPKNRKSGTDLSHLAGEKNENSTRTLRHNAIGNGFRSARGFTMCFGLPENWTNPPTECYAA